MIRDELDWLYWNRDRVSESDWWSWADDQDPAQVIRLAGFWLDHLDRHNRAGRHYSLVISISEQWYHNHAITVKQKRAVLAALREHWADLRVGSLA